MAAGVTGRLWEIGGLVELANYVREEFSVVQSVVEVVRRQVREQGRPATVDPALHLPANAA